MKIAIILKQINGSDQLTSSSKSKREILKQINKKSNIKMYNR